MAVGSGVGVNVAAGVTVGSGVGTGWTIGSGLDVRVGFGTSGELVMVNNVGSGVAVGTGSVAHAATRTVARSIDKRASLEVSFPRRRRAGAFLQKPTCHKVSPRKEPDQPQTRNRLLIIVDTNPVRAGRERLRSRRTSDMTDNIIDRAWVLMAGAFRAVFPALPVGAEVAVAVHKHYEQREWDPFFMRTFIAVWVPVTMIARTAEDGFRAFARTLPSLGLSVLGFTGALAYQFEAADGAEELGYFFLGFQGAFTVPLGCGLIWLSFELREEQDETDRRTKHRNDHTTLLASLGEAASITASNSGRSYVHRP